MRVFLDGAAAEKAWFPCILLLALPRPAEVTRNGGGVVGGL